MTDSDWDIPGIDRRASPRSSPLAADGPPRPAAPEPWVRPAEGDGSPPPAPPSGIQPAGIRPDSPAQALEYLTGALDYLAHANAASWPDGQQADCLRALAVAEARQVAAHARLLTAFTAPGGGLAGDGHRSPRAWLTWQARVTRRAATGHVSWMRRLAEHAAVADDLAAGTVSVSWARQICDWTDRLPEHARHGADRTLLDAAGRGTGLAGLADMAAEVIRQHASPDADDDGFEDRRVRLAATFDGAGRLEGDLTARCTAAVEAVLDSLGAVRGPEDTRTLAQRRHDALAEACTRLIAADCLPERAGQPVRLQLSITLEELASGGAGSPAGPGAACDTAILPIVTGHVDHDLLAELEGLADTSDMATAARYTDWQARHGDLLSQAVALLSGPAGHAAALRRGKLTGPAAAISLPLDLAGISDTIPAHLRRAVIARDKHCRFPGCDMPPACCDVHHIQHRKDGGRHALTNLTLLCRFHHLVAIHRWGWQITLNPDGTTTAVSPDGSKTLHSHAPPGRAA